MPSRTPPRVLRGASRSTIVQGPAGGALFGTTTVTAVAGVATFADLSIRKANKPAAKYDLKARSSGTFTATSSPTFSIFPAAASQLVYTRQPSTEKAGQRFDPAVTLTALDAFDNVATGFTGNVTVAIGTNPGGGTLPAWRREPLWPAWPRLEGRKA